MNTVMQSFKGMVMAVVVACAGAVEAYDYKFDAEGDWTWPSSVEINKGQAYTFWIDGLAKDPYAFLWVDVEGTTSDGDVIWPTYSGEVTSNDGEGNEYTSAYYVLLSEEDWDMVDASKATFKVTVSGGSPSTSFTFHKEAGSSRYFSLFPDQKGDDPGDDPTPVVTVPDGATEAKALSVSPKTVQDLSELSLAGSVSKTLLSGYGNVFYLKSTLTAGLKYAFGFACGTLATCTMYRSGESGTDVFETAKDITDQWQGCDAAYEVIPEKSGTYYFKLQGLSPISFTFYSAGLKARAIKDHYFETVLEFGETVEGTPGHVNNPMSGAYDDIIDDCLLKLPAFTKGATYLFSTEGAEVPLMMVLYNDAGKPVATNRYVAEGNCNVCIGWTATDAKQYYLGICEQLEEDDEPTYTPVQIKIEEVDLEDDEANLDLVPTQAEGSPFDVAGAKVSEACELKGTAWVNTFVIAARKGITYRAKARMAAGGSDNGLTLAVSAYQTVNKKKTVLTTAGSLDPRANVAYLQMTAAANGPIYIDVSVADDAARWGSGAGLAYGPYEVCAVAKGDYGVLKVDMVGASKNLMGWSLMKKDGSKLTGEPVYPAGGSLILEEGDYTLLAQTVKDFATPDKNGFGTYEVNVGEETAVTYEYADKADPVDDQFSGKDGKITYKPTSMTPSAKGVSFVRSLLTNDVADCYSFKATAGAFYKFAFTEKTGAPKIEVFGPDSTSEACEYVIFDDPANAVQICAEKGTYYVRVTHANGSRREHSAYTLCATMANPGQVKFDKTAVSVKDTAGYAEIKVSRTSADGRVRVKYRTEGYQAENDPFYVPAEGVLTWEPKDKAAKAIRVNLIPFAGYDTNKTVNVVLEPFDVKDESFDPDCEFPATFVTDTKTGDEIDTAAITVTASAKKAPGTIAVACETPKKPVVEVTAGAVAVADIPFERIAGSDGSVRVKVEVVKGTAKPGIDYIDPGVSYLTWKDDETQALSLTVNLMSSSDFVETKTFTLKLTAVTKEGQMSYEKVTLAASTVTVNVKNERYAQTFANFLKANAIIGVAAAEKTKGKWFIDNNGAIRNFDAMGTLTFTLTGPGVFVWKLKDEAEQRKTVAYGQKKDNTVVIEPTDILEYYRWEPIPENLVTLWQGVKYEYAVTNGATKLAAGTLPDGLKIEQDKATKNYLVRGTPTKVGYYYAKLGTDEINYEVKAAGTAFGTFNGLAKTFDTEDGLRSLASVTFTAAAGKLSAKVTVGGKSLTFADTGYASVASDGSDGLPPTFMAELPYAQKIGKETVTNWLSCLVPATSETNVLARIQPVAVQLQMAKLAQEDGKTYDDDVWFDGTLCRDNSKLTDWVGEAAAFAGYYTIGLVNPNAIPGEPRGNGYLTLTVDDKGKVKVSGMLADGTTVSASAVACLQADGDDRLMRVPLYAFKAKGYVFGGWLELSLADGEDTPVVSCRLADSELSWKSDLAAATRDGLYGYALTLHPVGGWYDTTENLRRAYLLCAISVSLPTWDDDVEELASALPEGYDFVAAAAPMGETVTIAGETGKETLSVDKQTMVKDGSTYDWTNSVNAANVKLTFKRTTGIVNGTFDLWCEGENAKGIDDAKKLYTGLKHNGILLLNRLDDGFLDDATWTTGFYLAPQTITEVDDHNKKTTRKWTGSYRFEFKATPVPR